jgi:hypothetical protein
MVIKNLLFSVFLFMTPIMFLQAEVVKQKKIVLYQPPQKEIFETTPFDEGETIVYKVTWAKIKAGDATIRVKRRFVMNDTEVFHVEVLARTNRFFSIFFKVDDKIESFFDTKSLHSIRYAKHLREGDYREKRVIDYDHELGIFKMNYEKLLDDNKKKTKLEEGIIPIWVKDPISSIFYLRVCDLIVGKQFSLTLNAEGKNYNVEVDVEKKEKMKTKIGKFETLKVKPTRLGWQGRVFEKQKSTLTIWLTDDDFRIPVLLKSKVKIGSLKFEITKWEKARSSAMELAETGEEED